MLVKTFGCALFGIEAIQVTIEVNIDRGINFYLVGLPDNAVKESQQRIEAAIINLGYYYPHRKIVINMAPADIRKEGSAYDLPIAIGIMAASEQVNGDLLEQFIIMGELSLDGTLKPIKGTLPIAIKAKQDGFRGLIAIVQVEPVEPKRVSGGIIGACDVITLYILLDVQFVGHHYGLALPSLRLGNLRFHKQIVFFDFILVFHTFRF